MNRSSQLPLNNALFRIPDSFLNFFHFPSLYTQIYIITLLVDTPKIPNGYILLRVSIRYTISAMNQILENIEFGNNTLSWNQS